MKQLTFVLICASFHCNNYNLVEKLENPGGKTAYADRLYAFVTSQKTKGDMSGLTSPGCSGTGFQRADCACTEIARSAGLLRSAESKFAAWLSSQAIAPIVDARCRIQGTVTGCTTTNPAVWYNTQKEVIASGMPALISGTLTAAIKYNEFRNPTDVNTVYTGTNASGVSATLTSCLGWVDNTGGNVAEAGDPTLLTNAWVTSGSVPCTTDAAVYCFAMP